jgi:hypothetical protein
MSAEKVTARSVFALFKSLSDNEQDEFVAMARQDFNNAVSDLDNENARMSLSEMTAIVDQMKAKTGESKALLKAKALEEKLDKRTVKPRKGTRDKEVVRLRDSEKLTFGQIAITVKLGSASAARTAYTREKIRQSKQRK